MRNYFLITLLLAMISSSVTAYDVVDRYVLHKDRFKTEEMFRPYGHDFYLGVDGWINKNVMEFIDDVEKASKTEGDTIAKVNQATEVLEKYKDTEQTLRAGAAIGIPFFSFRAFGFKIVPDIRLVHAHLGVNMGIRTQELGLADIASLVDMPAELEAAVAGVGSEPAAGDDIVQHAVDQGKLTAAQAAPYLGKYYWPNNPSVPNIFLYTQAEGTAGLRFNYFKKRWFGHLGLNALHRTDFKFRVTAESIARDSDLVELSDEVNSQMFLTFDYKLGYKWKYIQLFGSIEDFKITRLSDNVAKGGELVREPNPLLRLHAEAPFKWYIFKASPFIGIHKRSGYDFDNGIYLGAEGGAYAWGDRLALYLRGTFDKEHFTFTPRIKLWFMQVEGSVKIPMQSKVDDVKVSSIYGVNFRLFL